MLASAIQLKNIRIIQNNKGVSELLLKNYLKEQYDITKIDYLLYGQAQEVMRWLCQYRRESIIGKVWNQLKRKVS